MSYHRVHGVPGDANRHVRCNRFGIASASDDEPFPVGTVAGQEAGKDPLRVRTELVIVGVEVDTPLEERRYPRAAGNAYLTACVGVMTFAMDIR